MSTGTVSQFVPLTLKRILTAKKYKISFVSNEIFKISTALTMMWLGCLVQATHKLYAHGMESN